jgi:hypothetical protein
MSELISEQELEQENDYDSITLNTIRETIESMPKFNQIEVLRIIYLHKKTIINENKYGIHINLTELTTNILDKLSIYIDYVKTQEVQLSQAEQQKEDYKNNYFIKDNKDKNTINCK